MKNKYFLRKKTKFKKNEEKNKLFFHVVGTSSTEDGLVVEGEERDGARAIADAAVALPSLEGAGRPVVEQRRHGNRVASFIVFFFVVRGERVGDN